MKFVIAALAGIAALGVSACSKPAQVKDAASASATASVAAAPVVASDPKAFLTSLYAHYDGTQMNFSPFDTPEAYFDPEMLSLMDANDQATPDGEVGALDGDPICGCQDYQKLTADIEIKSVADKSAEAAVTLHDKGVAKPKMLIYKLNLIGNQWRIHDVSGKDMPSLRRLLLAATPKA